MVIISSPKNKIKDYPSKESTPPYDSSNFLTHGERRLSLADYLLLLKHVGRNQVGLLFSVFISDNPNPLNDRNCLRLNSI